MANTENQEAQTALTSVKTQIAEIEKNIQDATSADQIETVATNLQLKATEWNLAVQKQYMTQKQMDDLIGTVHQELIGQTLRNELTKSQTATEGTKQKMNLANIDKWSQEIQQGWQGLSNQEKIMKVESLFKEAQQANMGMSQFGATMQGHDPAATARQIDIVMGIGKKDFKKPEGRY